MLDTILYTLYLLFLGYCALSVLYLFVLVIWGRFFYREMVVDGKASNGFNRIAILIAAYKEDNIILSTVQHNLEQVYPREFYDIFVIADSFKPETIRQLRNMPIQVLEVSFVKSTKLKSLNEAFEAINGHYDIAVICDADNILANDVLEKFNQHFIEGASAVQGRRVAKNLDTPFAILDACSEGINNHIFRKGANAIGLSSSVIGSGMAFNFAMIKEVISEINTMGDVIVHEDKILQLKVLERRSKIYYLESALIFDEKVDSSIAFEQQRKRWISGQFIYLKKFFLQGLRELFKGNFSYFNIAVANNLIPPRALLFVLLGILTVVSLVVGKTFVIAAFSLFIAYFLMMLLSLPPELINKDLWHAILRFPKAIYLMVRTLFQGKKANKTFIHTVHTRTAVTNSFVVKKADKNN